MGMMKRFLKEHDRMGRKVPVAQAYLPYCESS